MIRHFIIMSSSYSSKTRIAMDYVLDGKVRADMLLHEIETIRKQCGESVSISTHFVLSESREWCSVVQADPFFAGVHLVQTLGEFVGLILEDRNLTGVDVAHYILSFRKCTHLLLEKLAYLCYAEYLCKTGKKLFDDKIYAFSYGPVVKSIYDKYKGNREEIEEEIQDTIAYMPIQSRLLFAEDGIGKIRVIKDTLEMFKDYTASKLVDLTHTVGGPWDSVDKNGYYIEIPDEVILKRHHIEMKTCMS